MVFCYIWGMELENNSFDSAISRSLRRTSANEQQKDRHKFPFEECYDENELRDEDIYVYYDPLGNTSFTWQPPEGIVRGKDGDFYKVDLGGLLDITGEPFMFSVSWKLDYRPYTLGKYAREHSFGMDCIEPISRTGKSYWTVRGDMTLPVKVTEKPLNWYSTDLTAEEFRKELYRRLRDAKETFLRKYEILRWKFRAKQAEVRRSLTVEECIKGKLTEDSLYETGYARLANGHELEITKINDRLSLAYDEDTLYVYLLNAHPFYERETIAFTLKPEEHDKLFQTLAKC